MCGSRELASESRCDCSVMGDVNVNADVGGCGCDDCSAESMAACAGSRREVSMSEKLGAESGIEGAGGGGMAFNDEAMASHAAFSSSRLFLCQSCVHMERAGPRTYRLTSSSSSCNVALFFSFCGLGFFTTGAAAVSSYDIVSLQFSYCLLACTTYPAEPV